ncbi:MAG TPA: putative motility protein [Ideonella sp.]|jgi:hypothetical protein|nr:putative motility protein [Ideonella sp.]
MDITSNSGVSAATAAAQSPSADAVHISVLRKALDSQAAMAAALIAAIPQPPQLATEGSLGTNVNTYA